MSLAADLRLYARFGLGLRRFLRNPITADEARERVRRHLADREDNFLRLVERAVFGHARSPYRALFNLAGCQLGDVRAMVAQRGLDATLLALRQAGVYVSFEEFKGRAPIVRDGREIPVSAADFDNPFLAPQYYTETGGSTGAGTRVPHELDYLDSRAVHYRLTYAAHGMLDAPMAVWRGVLPDGSGINTVLALSRFGRPPVRWFTPVGPPPPSLRLVKFRVATALTVRLGRALGVRVPRPELVPIEQAPVVARWASDAIREHGQCALHTVASRALRVSHAAKDEGLDLTGATFVVAGEAVTPGKARGIQSAGARYFPTYGSTEAGRLAMGCVHPVSSNDMHVLTDICAIVPYARRVPGAREPVPALNITLLLPASPKILINAESDDYGTLETRRCGCPLEALGFTTHVRDVRSFGKLTGEGVTMMGSEILHVLEEVLPTRFGGGPLDYQVVEEEDEHGLTRVCLAIHPSVPIADESLVIATFLDGMSRESIGAASGSEIWRQAGTVRVERMPPILTARGKLHPLYSTARHRRSAS